jgi:hypothetical protein
MQETIWCNEKDSVAYPKKCIKSKDVNVYMHDSGLICTHDYSCPCCRENSAVLDLSNGIMQPCRICSAKGYRIIKTVSFWKHIGNMLKGVRL